MNSPYISRSIFKLYRRSDKGGPIRLARPRRSAPNAGTFGIRRADVPTQEKAAAVALAPGAARCKLAGGAYGERRRDRGPRRTAALNHNMNLPGRRHVPKTNSRIRPTGKPTDLPRRARAQRGCMRASSPVSAATRRAGVYGQHGIGRTDGRQQQQVSESASPPI